METLDLHGVRHHEVDRLVENFVLLSQLPVRVITGSSLSMRTITTGVLDRHGLRWEYESHWNLGSIVVTHFAS